MVSRCKSVLEFALVYLKQCKLGRFGWWYTQFQNGVQNSRWCDVNANGRLNAHVYDVPSFAICHF